MNNMEFDYCLTEPMSNSALYPCLNRPPKTRSVARRGGVRSTPKGRRVDPKAREEVLALLGDAPRRRDLLIEHLHKIQDRYRLPVGAASGRARGRDEDGDGGGLRSGDVLSPLRRDQRGRDCAAGDHGPRLRLDRLRARRLARAAGEAAGAARQRTCACCTRLASAAAKPRRSLSSARIRSRTRPPSR